MATTTVTWLVITLVLAQPQGQGLPAFVSLSALPMLQWGGAALTARERQVMRLVAQGRLNKQIAFELGISEVTVKLHRSGVMKKMQASSVGELIRAWDRLPPEVRESTT